MNDKISFFGTLHEIESLSGKALKQITALWDAGEIRLLPDDLILMNKVIASIKRNLSLTLKKNHKAFGLITNKAIEGKVETN